MQSCHVITGILAEGSRQSAEGIVTYAYFLRKFKKKIWYINSLNDIAEEVGQSVSEGAGE